MFGFSTKEKIHKAVTRALATVDAEGDLPDLAPIEAIDPMVDAFRGLVAAYLR